VLGGRRLLARARRVGVRLGLVGGASEFTRGAYLVPRQVVLVTARHRDEEALWPVDLHMPLGFEPPRYALSIAAGAHGTGVLLAARAFLVNFVSAAHESVILEAGARSGRDGNKREAMGLQARPAVYIDAPRLDIAEGWLECGVEESRHMDDRVLVVARVLHAETRPSGPSLFHAWRPR